MWSVYMSFWHKGQKQDKLLFRSSENDMKKYTIMLDDYSKKWWNTNQVK